MTNHSQWLPACSTSWTAPGPELYRALTNVGIHHVEYCGGRLSFWQDNDFIHKAGSIVAQMREYDITPSSMHLPFSPFEEMDLTTSDAAQRAKIVDMHTQLLQAGAEVGIPIAVIHPSGEPYRAMERGERMKCAIDALHSIAEAAQNCGIRLAVENLPRTCLGNIHEEIQLILNEIPSLYACFDTNHSLRQPNPDFIRALSGRIIATHVSDYDMIDERHLLPYLGRNDWPAIVTALEEADYQGFFTFEVSCKGVLTAENLRLAYDKIMGTNVCG